MLQIEVRYRFSFSDICFVHCITTSHTQSKRQIWCWSFLKFNKKYKAAESKSFITTKCYEFCLLASRQIRNSWSSICNSTTQMYVVGNRSSWRKTVSDRTGTDCIHLIQNSTTNIEKYWKYCFIHCFPYNVIFRKESRQVRQHGNSVFIQFC